MRKAQKLHREAMELVEQALLERNKGCLSTSNEFLQVAFYKELEAAMLLERKLTLEPTRSVLFRSAASLALECGDILKAERLIAQGLSGDPPSEIAEELRNLLEDVNFRRHLKLRGITLEPDEFQFSLEGSAVGFGITNSSHFVDRIRYVETSVYRTAERLLKRPFRESGGPKKALKEELELYLSVPRAASFAVTFKLGRGDQLKIPGMDSTQKVVDEVIDCFELFESGRVDELKTRIPDPAYYRNFIGLAKSIAPDGKNIRTVGLTTFRNNEERNVALKRTVKQAQRAEMVSGDAGRKAKEIVNVQGTLLFADALKQKKGLIQVRDGAGKINKIRVPEGMMGDIVKPLWECEVMVTGFKKKNTIYLEDINKMED